MTRLPAAYERHTDEELMAAIQQGEVAAFDALYQRVLALMKYRIPLYQAALATAAIVLVLPAVHTLFLSKLTDEAGPSNSTHSIQMVVDSTARSVLPDEVDSLRLKGNSKRDSLILK